MAAITRPSFGRRDAGFAAAIFYLLIAIAAIAIAVPVAIATVG